MMLESSGAWGLDLTYSRLRRQHCVLSIVRHLTLFMVGALVAIKYSLTLTRDTRAFLEFRTDAHSATKFSGPVSEPAEKFLIPNYLHYIRINRTYLRFFEAVCMKSAFLIQRPERIYLHSDVGEVTGPHWDHLLAIPGFKEVLVMQRVTVPETVFGTSFYWIAHKADVLRLLILKRYGGIYMDNDVYVINNLDHYRRYEFTLGWPNNEWIGNMLLMANKDARLLSRLVDLYQLFRPDIWYYNGGEKPVREILYRNPELVHNEKVRLGVSTNVAWFFYVRKEIWKPEQWTKDYDTVHLLIGHRHDIDPRYLECKEFDADNVKEMNMSVAMMFRYTWFGSIHPFPANTSVDMAEVNRQWLLSRGNHSYMWNWSRHHYPRL